MIPLVYANDRAAIDAALQTIGLVEPHNARVARIRDTLHLAELELSEACLAPHRPRPNRSHLRTEKIVVSRRRITERRLTTGFLRFLRSLLSKLNRRKRRERREQPVVSRSDRRVQHPERVWDSRDAAVRQSWLLRPMATHRSGPCRQAFKERSEMICPFYGRGRGDESSFYGTRRLVHDHSD